MKRPKLGKLAAIIAIQTDSLPLLDNPRSVASFRVTKKNSRTMTDKLVKKKYDPVAKKHVEFRESKIK